MRTLVLIILTATVMTGCNQSRPVPTQSAPPAIEPDPTVEVGGPQGGVHVNDPAGGTKVDVDGSGVHVKSPESRVDVP